jgi:hypothetical protein
LSNSDATITRTELIKRAFRRIGIWTPSTNDLSNAVGLLNDVVKMIDVHGKWLWAIDNTPTALTISSGTQSYSCRNRSDRDRKLHFGTYPNGACHWYSFISASYYRQR